MLVTLVFIHCLFARSLLKAVTGFCLSAKIRNSSKRCSWWGANKNCRDKRERMYSTALPEGRVSEAEKQEGNWKGLCQRCLYCGKMNLWEHLECSILHIKESEFQSISIVTAASTRLGTDFLLCLGPEFPLQTKLWLGWSARKWALFWCTMMHGRPWKPTRYAEVGLLKPSLIWFHCTLTCFLLFPVTSIIDKDE